MLATGQMSESKSCTAFRAVAGQVAAAQDSLLDACRGQFVFGSWRQAPQVRRGWECSFLGCQPRPEERPMVRDVADIVISIAGITRTARQSGKSCSLRDNRRVEPLLGGFCSRNTQNVFTSIFSNFIGERRMTGARQDSPQGQIGPALD